jgi:hypothetical protein
MILYTVRGTTVVTLVHNRRIFVNQPQTMTIPEAGKTYFSLSRNGSYAAAKRGDIPTIRIGKLLRVPIRALEQQLNATLKSELT